MTYEAAVAALRELPELTEVAAAITAEHELYERQTLVLQHLTAERRACTCAADDPLAFAPEPLSPEAAMLALEQIGAWFSRREAPEFASSLRACRQTLAQEHARAERLAPKPNGVRSNCLS